MCPIWVILKKTKEGMAMQENADKKKQEREQIIELGSDITKSSKGRRG